MESVQIEYNLGKNQWRTTKQSDNFVDRSEWLIIGKCESDEAEAFIKAIVDFQSTPLAFRFSEPSFIDIFFKQHSLDFAIRKKREEYLASGENIVILT